ncbi:MAG: two-component regulator propeller domain-containing protein [Verrucomicrobiota bacterium]
MNQAVDVPTQLRSLSAWRHGSGRSPGVQGCLLIFAILTTVLAAQAVPFGASAQYRFEKWEGDDGLIQNTVNAVVQSREGYIWIGTDNGLTRYDGNRFKPFTSRDEPGLSGDRITALFVDRHNQLWIGTQSGVTRYRDGHPKKFTTNDGLANNAVTAIGEAMDGGLWVATEGGALNRFDDFSGTEIATFVPSSAGNTGNTIETIVPGDDGRLWVANQGFFGYYQNGEFFEFKEGAQEVDAAARRKWNLRIGASRDGGLWVTKEGRLRKFQKGAFEGPSWGLPPAQRDARITALLEDEKGYVWIGTYRNGLLRFKDGEFEMPAQGRLTSDSILCLFEDREQILWIGTGGGGLNQLKDRFFEVVDRSSGLSEDAATSIIQAGNGDMWIGTDGGGLNRLRDGEVKVFGAEEGLTDAFVATVFEDSRRSLWVGTRFGGLFEYKDGKFKRYGRAEGLSSLDIRAIYEDSAGRLWIGTIGGGLNRLSALRIVGSPFTRDNGLSSNDIRAIHEDRKGNMWIGTRDGGLNRLKDSRFYQYGRDKGLPSESIRVIFEDSEGILWVGTSGGLARYKDKDDRFFAFTKQNGLHDDVISQMFEDSEGDFWFGSNRGIFRVKRRELLAYMEGRAPKYECISYARADGMSNSECKGESQPSGARSKDGRYWFPTIRGVTVVDPKNKTFFKRPPNVVIEEVRLDGEPKGIEEMVNVVQGKEKEIIIPPGTQRVEFHYTALMSFSSPRRVRFRYKLDGIDKDWVEGETRRMAYYVDLPPGRYTFTVIAANNEGFWNTTGSSIGLLVQPPFYRTWWFISCMGVVAASMVGMFVRYLLQRQLEQRLRILEQQHALDRERARIAQDMHDDLGARVTQIGLLSERVKRQTKNPSEVGQLAERILTTTREVVDTLDEIVWAVNPKNDTLDRVGPYIAQYAEAYFEPTDIRCRLDVPTELPGLPITADLRHNLYLVVKEALNNVAKHSQAKEVWLRLKLDKETLQVAVEDDGKGFVPEQASTSRNGLFNMKKRIEDSGGKCDIVSRPGHGTSVRVTCRLNGPVAPPSNNVPV